MADRERSRSPWSVRDGVAEGNPPAEEDWGFLSRVRELQASIQEFSDILTEHDRRSQQLAQAQVQRALQAQAAGQAAEAALRAEAGRRAEVVRLVREAAARQAEAARHAAEVALSSEAALREAAEACVPALRNPPAGHHEELVDIARVREQAHAPSPCRARWTCAACDEPNKATRDECNNCKKARTVPQRSSEAVQASDAATRAESCSSADVAVVCLSEEAVRPAEVGGLAEDVVICLSDDESACQDAGAGNPEIAPLSVAEDYAECSICLEPMHSQPTVVLADEHNKRVCRHYYHADCARTMMSARGGQKCAHCRSSYSALLPVPDVAENPRAWFQVVDMDGDGSLSCEEVGDVLKATLPVDYRKLQRMLPALCAKWSTGGCIGYEEMMGPDGLFCYARDTLGGSREAGDVPDIRKFPDAWFHYWDEDESGTLSREQVVRAIVKTFKLKTTLRQIRTVRSMLMVLWPEFDPDLGGCIDKAEFCRPHDGLAQMIIVNLRLPANEGNS